MWVEYIHEFSSEGISPAKAMGSSHWGPDTEDTELQTKWCALSEADWLVHSRLVFDEGMWVPRNRGRKVVLGAPISVAEEVTSVETKWNGMSAISWPSCHQITFGGFNHIVLFAWMKNTKIDCIDAITFLWYILKNHLNCLFNTTTSKWCNACCNCQRENVWANLKTGPPASRDLHLRSTVPDKTNF